MVGCTELPLVLNARNCPGLGVALVDPMRALAAEIVKLTLASRRNENSGGGVSVAKTGGTVSPKAAGRSS